MFINDIKYNGPAIYSLYNTINGKLYIGKTAHYRDRIQEHKSRLNNNKHCNDYLQKTFKKYKESFIASIIEVCKKENLGEREIFWISFLNTTDFNKGYNMTSGGEGTFGIACSEEKKEKIRKTNRKFLDSEEGIKLRKQRSDNIKNRIIHPAVGRVVTPEESKRLSTKLKETYKLKKNKGWVNPRGIRVEILNKDREVLGTYNSITDIDPIYNINPDSVLTKISKWKRKKIVWTEMTFRFNDYILRKI